MTEAQTLNHSDKDDAQRLEWLREHGEQIGTQNGTTTWRMADGSRVERTSVMGAACYGTLPAECDIVEKRRETVPASCTLQDHDAVLVTGEGPRVDAVQGAVPGSEHHRGRHQVHGHAAYGVVHGVPEGLRRC